MRNRCKTVGLMLEIDYLPFGLFLEDCDNFEFYIEVIVFSLPTI